MRIFRGFEGITGLINPVVTTGSFDGVHTGHKKILERVNTLAKKNSGESVLITFHPHPRKVLYPDTLGRDLKLINTQEEKLFLLDKTGLDNIIIVEFTHDFSRITSEQFVREYLSGIIGAKVIVAGFNHHFGFNKEGDYRQLWNLQSIYGFEAVEIPEQEVQHETVSSTRIRKAISEGYIQRANAYLDHFYIILGRPVPEDFVSSRTGLRFFHIPIPDDSKLLPPCGVYAVTVDTKGYIGKGMILINKDITDKVAVFLYIPEERNISGTRTSLLFQKRITGNLNISDQFSSKARLEKALAEISELIY